MNGGGGPSGVDIQDSSVEGKSDGERVGTIFLVKEDEEYCFLYERDDPAGLYSALFGCADSADLGLSGREALEMIEGMVPDRLRAI